MSTLPQSALDRLSKMMGMLGSDHDGERAAAALKCTELLRAHGMTWAEFVKTIAAAPAHPHPSSGYAWTPRPPPPPPEDEPWKAVAQACLDAHENNEIPPFLTPWEETFVKDILSRGYSLSDKQMAVLTRIATKMGVNQQ